MNAVYGKGEPTDWSVLKAQHLVTQQLSGSGVDTPLHPYSPMSSLRLAVQISFASGRYVLVSGCIDNISDFKTPRNISPLDNLLKTLEDQIPSSFACWRCSDGSLSEMETSEWLSETPSRAHAARLHTSGLGEV